MKGGSPKGKASDRRAADAATDRPSRRERPRCRSSSRPSRRHCAPNRRRQMTAIPPPSRRRASTLGIGLSTATRQPRRRIARRSRPPGPLAAAVRRDDYIGPVRARAKSHCRRSKVSRPPRKKGEGGPTERTPSSHQARPDAQPGQADRWPGQHRAARAKAGHEAAGRCPRRRQTRQQTARGSFAASRKDLGARPREARRQAAATSSRSRTRDSRPAAPRRQSQRAKKSRPEGKPMLGGREQRQLQRRRNAVRGGWRRPTGPHLHAQAEASRHEHCRAAQGSRHASICPARSASFRKQPASKRAQIQRVLMDEGVMATITAVIDPTLAETGRRRA